MHYHAGFALTGCLPDNDPITTTDINDAISYMLDELRDRIESVYTTPNHGYDDELQETQALLTELSKNTVLVIIHQGWSGYANPYHYWIEPCHDDCPEDTQ